jgi:hypothetical protein
VKLTIILSAVGLGTAIASTGNAQDAQMNKLFLFLTAVFSVLTNCGWQVLRYFVRLFVWTSAIRFSFANNRAQR